MPQKPFHLQDRTQLFAQDIRQFLSKLPRHHLLAEDSKQLLRSSGSVGANYIEADEALGPKDFAFRLRICRKEAKESAYWLGLLRIDSSHPEHATREELKQEATELTRIFSAILTKL